MSLSRYAVADAYTLEELRREYQMTDAKGRIRLLKKLNRYTDTLPIYMRGQTTHDVIALLAVDDPNVEVRQWIARHGKYLEENLKNGLKNDQDPFVRACLRENSGVFGLSRGEEDFREASHLERLALVRNPKVETDLIEKIFHPENKEIGINLTERRELVHAFLTNDKTLAQIIADADIREYEAPPEIAALICRSPFGPEIAFHAGQFLRKIWKFASKWPAESGVPYLVYKHVPVSDDTKAEIYLGCDDINLRWAILNSCTRGYVETLKLGVKDKDETCRFIACCTIPSLEPELLDAILKGKDKAALKGLALNKSLSLEMSVNSIRNNEVPEWLRKLGYDKWSTQEEETIALLEHVKDRLREVDKDNIFLEDTNEHIKQLRAEVENKRLLKDPESLFDDGLFEDRSQQGNFLEHKIDFIGRRLLSFEKEITMTMVQHHKDVQWLIVVGVIGIGVLLFRSFFG